MKWIILKLAESNKYITFEMTKYNELIRILERDGWYIMRQKGSHIIMQHREKEGQLTVPFHSGKEVKGGLLKAILKQADIKLNKR